MRPELAVTSLTSDTVRPGNYPRLHTAVAGLRCTMERITLHSPVYAGP